MNTAVAVGPPVQYYQAIAALIPLLLFTCFYQAKIFGEERGRRPLARLDLRQQRGW